MIMRDASTVYFALLRWPLGLISKELKVFPLRVNTWGPPSVPNWLALTGRRIWSCGILPLSCVSEKQCWAAGVAGYYYTHTSKSNCDRAGDDLSHIA